MLNSIDVNEIKYSAVIRTTGYSQELEMLVESLSNQTIKPAEILLCLPFSVAPFSLKHFNTITRFVYSKKGAVSQRKEGILNAKYSYLLLLDDDIVFTSNNAVENLFVSLLNNNAEASIPYAADAYPTGIKKIIYAIFGIAVPTSKRRFISYLPSGGSYYPDKPDFKEPYIVEGGLGRCVATVREFLLKNSIFGDPELEKIPYAIREDGSFIYSISTAGGKTIMIDSAPYKHLGEVRASTTDRLYYSYEASVFSNYIFWRNSIRKRYKNKIIATLAFIWSMIGYVVLSLLSSVSRRSLMPFKGMVRGFIDLFSKARKY